MNEEQFQRQVDFILDQQAKFSVDIAKLQQGLAAFQKESRENFAKLGDIILSLANYNQQQDERIAAHDRQIAALIEAGKETDARIRETNERLNAVIILAERFFSRNGRQGSSE